MIASSLLVTIQALDAAERRVNPLRFTLAALREAVALQVANRSAPDSDGRYQAIIPAAQMAELREDPAFVAALASGEVEIVDRPLRAHQRSGGAYLALRPGA